MKVGHLNRSSRRIYFGLTFVLLFVIALVVWWTIFLRGFVMQTNRLSQERWTHDQASLRSFSPLISKQDRATFLKICARNYPHIDCDREHFSFKPSWLRRRAFDQRHLRMFFYEGGVFVFMVFLGLYLVFQGIRAERELRFQQRNFLSAVSHEVRTPLGAMRLLLETLQIREFDEEKRVHYLKRLEQQLARMQTTCDQLLAAAMLEKSEAKNRFDCIDLNHEVKRLCEDAFNAFAMEQIDFRVEESNVPLWVELDVLALDVILKNLIDNAIKYNPDVQKRVSILVKTEASHAVITISDNGPGIFEMERRKIFDAFYRSGDELVRETNGLGLGLHLVKELTEWMKGQVRHQNTAHGSDFSIFFPLSTLSQKRARKINGDKGKDV